MNDRLGTGWAFPPEPVPPSKTLQWRSGPELVSQSIQIILETEPGERLMRPTFGCGIRARYLFSPNTPATRAQIGREIEAALRTWEPRIEVHSVEVVPTDDPSTVLITISYVHVRDQTPAVLRLPLALGVVATGTENAPVTRNLAGGLVA